MSKFYFVIAKHIKGKRKQFYTIYNTNILYNNKKEAKAYLNYIFKQKNNTDSYKIYKLKFKEVIS